MSSYLFVCLRTPCPAGGVVEARQAHGGGVDEVGGCGGVCSAATAAAASAASGRRATVITTTGDLIFGIQRHCVGLPRLRECGAGGRGGPGGGRGGSESGYGGAWSARECWKRMLWARWVCGMVVVV